MAVTVTEIMQAMSAMHLNDSGRAYTLDNPLLLPAGARATWLRDTEANISTVLAWNAADEREADTEAKRIRLCTNLINNGIRVIRELRKELTIEEAEDVTFD